MILCDCVLPFSSEFENTEGQMQRDEIKVCFLEKSFNFMLQVEEPQVKF